MKYLILFWCFILPRCMSLFDVIVNYIEDSGFIFNEFLIDYVFWHIFDFIIWIVHFAFKRLRKKS